MRRRVQIAHHDRGSQVVLFEPFDQHPFSVEMSQQIRGLLKPNRLPPAPAPQHRLGVRRQNDGAGSGLLKSQRISAAGLLEGMMGMLDCRDGGGGGQVPDQPLDQSRLSGIRRSDERNHAHCGGTVTVAKGEIEGKHRIVIAGMISRSLVLILLPLTLWAQAAPAPQEPIKITAEPLGDVEAGVVMRVALHFNLPADVPAELPLVAQGSFLQGGKVVRNFRWVLRPTDRTGFEVIQTLPAGELEMEVRLLSTPEEATPMLLAKTTSRISVAPKGTPYVAGEEGTAEGMLAEGVVPESSGSIRILPPRRDLAPHLFLVDVEVKPPIRRVEFFVDGKKIFTKNAPPYRTELDLGAIPRRVEVRVVGYDPAGRYVDADAWIVNERETPLEVKITRTVTGDEVSHFKISIQNPKNTRLQKVELFAGDRKLHEWIRPPYAFDIANAQLGGVEFIRASALDETGFEATDLLYLDGGRYFEELEVNLVELPVSVLDLAGAAVVDLKQEDFQVFEEKKPQKISGFGFSTDLPLSVGVLVDHSGSMLPRIKDARTAAIEFFKQIIGPRDRAFFGGFSWQASDITPFVAEIASLESQVSIMPEAQGGTALHDAIISGLYRFRTIPGRKALVIVTDGEDTVSRITYDDMLHYVRAARVPLYFIGVGMSALDFGVTSKLKGLAAETGGMSYFVRDVKALKDVYAQLEKELRTQYLISYYTQSSKNDRAYRTVEVRTTRPGVKVRTVRGFIP